MSDDIRVYRKHLRQIEYCRRGSAAMAKRLGLDWSRFLKEGIALSELEKIDDVAVQRLVKHVRDKNGK